MRTSWIIVAAFMSFGAIAQVSDAEKVQRVQFVQEIGDQVPQVNADSFQRDLEYDKQNLSLEERTQRELNLLTERVKAAVVSSYQEKIDNNQDPESAYNEVRESIENDLNLADPSFRYELSRIALSALDTARDGGVMSEVQTSSLQDAISKNVEERFQYLNSDAEGNTRAETSAQSNNPYPSTSRAKDAERLNYSSRQEIVKSLASSGDNTKWVSTASASQDLGKSISADASVSIRLKFKFLGTGIEGGPTISFTRSVTSNASLMYEGIDTVIDSEGRFNIWKKDFDGKIIVKNGEKQRRFMAFYCSVSTSLASTYKGEASISFDAGAGSMSGSTSLSNYQSTSNSITSRRIYIPDTINGQIVTVNTIRQLCWKDFPNAEIRRGVTVKQSLYNMTANSISSMAFSHPKSKCAVDTQCMPWARRLNIAPAVKNGVYPRCIEDSKEKFRSCQLRGLENSECAVYDRGALVSREGLNGCDYGLRCAVQSAALYFPGTSWVVKAANGVCKPVNARSYRRPVFR